MKYWIIYMFVILLSSACVSADEYSSAYLEFKQINTDDFTVLWKVPANVKGKREKLRVEFPADASLSNIRKFVVSGVFTERLNLSRQGGLAGTSIEVMGLGEVATDVLVRIERLNGSSETARLDSSSSSFVVAGEPQFMEVVNTYVVFGIEHILSGLDHLLFVACLIFIAGQSDNRYQRLFLTITGFTLAHSVTLAMAALGLFRLPIVPIEATIALSIVFLAREISLDRRDTLTWRYPVAISACFGLLHGFGFASALSEMGLPAGEVSAALLAFNVGVEVGQLLFVASLLLVYWVVHNTLKISGINLVNARRRLEKSLSLAVGSVAMVWTLERMPGLFS